MESCLVVGFLVKWDGGLITQTSKELLQKRKGHSDQCLPCSSYTLKRGDGCHKDSKHVAGWKQFGTEESWGWGGVEQGTEFFCFLEQLLEGRGNRWTRKEFRLFFCVMYWQIPRIILHGYCWAEAGFKAAPVYSGSVQFSRSVMSDSLQPHGLQHARPPCLSPTPGVHSYSCALSQWCHPTISSSVIPFSSYLQSFPASGSFPRSQFFESGSQSIGVSASTSVLPMNIPDWFPLAWTG